MVGAGFGVYLNSDIVGDNVVDGIVDKLSVPGGVLNARGEVGGIVPDFVKVADNVETAGIDHFVCLRVE